MQADVHLVLRWCCLIPGLLPPFVVAVPICVRSILGYVVCCRYTFPICNQLHTLSSDLNGSCVCGADGDSISEFFEKLSFVRLASNFFQVFEVFFVHRSCVVTAEHADLEVSTFPGRRLRHICIRTGGLQILQVLEEYPIGTDVFGDLIMRSVFAIIVRH